MKDGTPICEDCRYLCVEPPTRSREDKRGIPRGRCRCSHPEAPRLREKVCPKSVRQAAFIGFTACGSKPPRVKTSPRWCPRKFFREPDPELSPEP